DQPRLYVQSPRGPANRAKARLFWSVIGGIAATTKVIRLGTGVTCPLLRINPPIIAQAAATAAAMMPGRFFLGLSRAENLNEQVIGNKWPAAAARQGMPRKRSRSSECCGKAATKVTAVNTSQWTTRASIHCRRNRRRFTSRRAVKRWPKIAAEIGDGVITAGD